MPELGMEVTLSRFHLGVLLGMFILVPNGPKFGSYRQIGVHPTEQQPCPTDNPGHVLCTPNVNIIPDERAYGSFQIWLPQITAGYTF
jgi:hypothetical protein